MSETFLENVAAVRASLDELEAAARAVECARARYHEVASRLAGRLGSPLPVEQLALPAPIEVKEQPAEKAPPPAAAVAPKPPKPKARPVREARSTPTAGEPACFRAHGRDGACRGKVAVVKCQHNCGWTRALCEAHREGGRESMALSAHNRVAHSAAGKAHMRELQTAGAAARDGRPKHRTAKAKAAAVERKPASPATDRRKLIAQRMKAASRQVCLVCQKPGHNSRTCPRRRDEADEAEDPRPAMGALDVQGFEELDAGHDVTPRAGVGVEE